MDLADKLFVVFTGAYCGVITGSFVTVAMWLRHRG
jgi:hypothetical protein